MAICRGHVVEFKVENLCGFLIRSKLMAPNEVQTMRQRWAVEAKENAGSATQFLKWIVVRNYVTEYQASLLSRGHVDDFFLGEYKVLERVGRGRMAGVYRSVHPSGQIVAIKVLPPSRAKNALTLARFERESRLAVRLNHPHVVRAFQLGQTKNVHYLVMEYLEGEPLDEVLQRRKRLPPHEAVRLIHQALLGLQHIHEQGMVHRDLKPANLMLLPAPAPSRGSNETTLKSNLKILDIGLAREFYDENAPEDSEQTELTGEGVLLGTPDYLAPEQARDPRNIDIRADIYSLGCTLYHLLTGQPPFPDKNILNQMVRHATEAPKPLQDFVPSIPEGLTQIIDWMMAKQPDKRYPTPLRAAQALAAFLMVASEPAKPVEESPQMQKYLTWLETEDKQSVNVEPAASVKSSPRVPNAAVKPASNPGTPVPKSTPSPKPTNPRKAKRGTDADVPVPKPVSPPPAVEEYDVELITASNVPEPSRGIGKRDLLMLALGIVLMVIVNGMCLIAWFVGQLLLSE
jgi:serine/threonine protein kinase